MVRYPHSMAIITFGGRIGAGKTTVAPVVARAFGYEEMYVGKIFRELARERGLSIEAFYDSLGGNPDLERSIDASQIALMKEKDNLIVQGRIAFFFAKQSGKPSINVFLDVAPRAGAERKMNEGFYVGKTVEEVIAIHALREQNERDHYRSLYGITNHLDPRAFDVVCDATHLSPEEVAAFLIFHIQNIRPAERGGMNS